MLLQGGVVFKPILQEGELCRRAKFPCKLDGPAGHLLGYINHYRLETIGKSVQQNYGRVRGQH